VAGDGVLLPDSTREALGRHLDRIHLTLFWNPTPDDTLSASFIRRYIAETGEYPSHDHALFRDGLMLLAAAVEAVGPDRGQIREYVLSLGRTRPPFQGVTGPIAFTPSSVHPVFILRADSLSSR
jgi:ABC-type branched-subunit amino acid transport system substrate-binding protein